MNFSLLISLFLFIGGATAATFTVRNNCRFTVWPADIPTGGGTRLNPGQTWTFNVPAGTAGRVWGRVGCSPNGSGCQTGDCGGALQCRLSGRPPATLAEYKLNGGNNLDYLDISLVDGFNLPMEFAANSAGCNQGRRCTADINGQCPAELRVPGGCNNRAGYASFFKQRCPGAYSFPQDDPTSIFTCRAGANYRVVFCP